MEWIGSITSAAVFALFALAAVWWNFGWFAIAPAAMLLLVLAHIRLWRLERVPVQTFMLFEIPFAAFVLLVVALIGYASASAQLADERAARATSDWAARLPAGTSRADACRHILAEDPKPSIVDGCQPTDDAANDISVGFAGGTLGWVVTTKWCRFPIRNGRVERAVLSSESRYEGL